MKKLSVSLSFLVAFVFCEVRHLPARVHVPGIDSSKLDVTLKGRVLIEELNCVACHKAPAVLASSRKSPRLSLAGSRVNPDYLKAFIQSPHQVKPGTLMPDLLGHLEPGEKEKVAEELADILIYTVRLADRLGVDLEQSAKDKLTKNRRKYPVEKARGKATKYTEL